MDPHLACQDINLWGSGMADSSGTFTISGWPPSGAQEQDYPASGPAPWSYDQSMGGSQVLAVINVQTLIANAAANGDAPKNKQGYHFKLQFSQDPQKHKTFWVNCPAPSSSPPPGNTTPPPTTSTPSGSTTPTSTPTRSVSGVKAVKKHHKKKHHKRRKRRAAKAVRRTIVPSFTG
jgi:hypothetical protein